MFDATPLSVSLWDMDGNILDCNRESAKLFDLEDKKDFMEHFYRLSPKYQPCGGRSIDMAHEYVQKAFDEGSCRFEWMHLSSGGEELPCEIILVRVEYKGKPTVAAYIRDLSELKATLAAMHKVEDDLRLALVFAEDNARAKDEFLDNMNHELRTPMNGILGFLRMASQAGTDVIQLKHIADAERSAKDLMHIIDDVLDFTEIEKNKMRMDVTKFKLSDILNNMRETYAPAARAKNLEFIVRLPQDLPELVIGDPMKLRKLLINLVDNAVKFTEKGKVTVRASVTKQTDSQVEMSFYVRDTGIGMKPEQMKSLFTPFWQADSSSTRKYGGTGLGLALAKHLAQLLGGKLWAESEYEEGSTFYFTARFSLPDASAISPYQESKTEPIKEEAVASEQIETRNNMHLLLVDDAEINQMVAEALLTSMGYTVDTANNGQEAIDMIEAHEYDAVLMDIQMPVMDGLSATARIRESDKYKDLPIIAVSAHAMSEDKEKSLNSGMNDHITKPIDPDTLFETLNKWLQPA